MRTTVRFAETDDEVIEVRVAIRDRVIVSRVNYTHLARVRQTLAAIERAIRIGLYELALAPESVSRDFLSKAAVQCVDHAATARSRSGVVQSRHGARSEYARGEELRPHPDREFQWA